MKAWMIVALGSILGGSLRWGLSQILNPLSPVIPPGTVVANFLGGYLVGLAVMGLSCHPHVAPEWRLFLVTGLCGGLTTFSTFSVEVLSLLQQGRFLWAIGMIVLHLIGTLAMTALGMLSMHWWLTR